MIAHDARRAIRTLLAESMVVAVFATAPQALGEGAHVHGEAVLEVSVAGPGLSVVLRGPAQVFFGFEHPPTTQEEANAIEAALASLRAPASSVVAVSSACALEAVSIDSPFPAEVDAHDEREDADRHDTHEHDDRHHADENHDGDHHEHEKEHENGDGAHMRHTDLEAEYRYRCDGSAPDSLTLIAFSAFPRLERVEAAWLTDAAAGSAELSKEAMTLKFETP